MPSKEQEKIPSSPRDFIDKHGVTRYPTGNFQLWSNRQHTQPVHNALLGQCDHERGCRMKWFDKFGSRIDKYKTITGKSSFYMEPGWSKKAISDVKEDELVERRRKSLESEPKPLGRFPSILNETIRTREIGITRVPPVTLPLPGGASLQYPVNPKEYLPLYDTPTVDLLAGRREYLRQRRRINLRNRMVAPVTTSMEYGWNLGGPDESFLWRDKAEREVSAANDSAVITKAEQCSQVHGQIEKQFSRSQSGARDTFNTTHERITDAYGFGRLLQDHV